MTADDEILDWLQLINTENIGPKTFYKLKARFGSVAAALKNLPSKFTVPSREETEELLQNCRQKNITIIIADDKLYPKSLTYLDDAPPVLYAAGNLDLLSHHPALAVVGTRNASINGRKIASRISYDLTTKNVLIVSGMARGIDSAAHKGAMYAHEQKGPTLSVIGTGIDIVYPRENQQLHCQIAAQGLIISELPPGTTPQAANFPRRNRLVAALADGTLVVEATLHSGSLITARHTSEAGKTVFAIPGSPNDARAAGPNRLLKEGAVLVESATDIFRLLQDIKKTPSKTLRESPRQELFELTLDKSEKNADIPIHQTEKTDIVLSCISADGVYVDEIIRSSGLDASEVSLILLELEISGKIERQTGNKVALLK